MRRDLPIVTVELTIAPPPIYEPNFAVVIDWTTEALVGAARAHPGVFIFTFVTRTDLDYSTLKEASGPLGDFIVLPMFIGNIPEEERADYIIKYVEAAMGPDGKKVTL